MTNTCGQDKKGKSLTIKDNYIILNSSKKKKIINITNDETIFVLK